MTAFRFRISTAAGDLFFATWNEMYTTTTTTRIALLSISQKPNLKRLRCGLLEPRGALSVLGYDDTWGSDLLHDILGADQLLRDKKRKPF